jgi:CheY-like chemotaxis protein
MLEAARMQVTCLGGGQPVAQTLIEAEKQGAAFDICLIDLGMPDMNGYQVAESVRGALEKPPYMIALSSALERDAAKCEAAGFDGFQAKPVRRPRLVQMMGRLLGEGAKAKEAAPEDGRRKMHTQYSVREALKHSVSILLAEDNPVNQKLASLMLGKAGYQVDVAGNGREAVEKYSAAPEKYDLIFMDVQMPEMDGQEASRKLRESGYADVPIVAMTANAMKGDREMCLAAGMNDYVTKPIKREQVFEMIAKYVLNRSAA